MTAFTDAQLPIAAACIDALEASLHGAHATTCLRHIRPEDTAAALAFYLGALTGCVQAVALAGDITADEFVAGYRRQVAR